MIHGSKRLLLAVALTAGFPAIAQAGDTATEARMQELERQLQALTQELATIRQQMAAAPAVGKPAQVPPRPAGKAGGSPVYAAFKDGITFSDDSGNWKLALNGRVQADYRKFFPDADAADTFSLRRARLGGTFTFYRDYVARVEGEYSSASTVLTYAYIDINKFKAARLRLGQFKPFYGLERAMSTNFTDFQERSLADALLGGSFDRGVMVFGSPWTGVNYSLAYVNGTGTADESDVRNDGKDATMRIAGNIAEMAGWKKAVLHVGGFYADGHEGHESSNNAVSMRTEGRGLTFFSANRLNKDIDRRRDGFETALAYGPLKLQGEYIETSFDGADYERDLNAWYASAMWNVTGETFASSYRDGMFGRLHPRRNFNSDGSGWGALQLGLRYSRFDGSDFESGGATGSNEADAWTLGANWILNPNVRIVTNLVHTRYDTPVLVNVDGRSKSLNDEDALTMRAQFDF